MANYPEILDNFTPKVDDTNDVMAVDVNELQTAISALETKVGIDESEDTTSLDYKIAQLQSGKQDALGLGTKGQLLATNDDEDGVEWIDKPAGGGADILQVQIFS